MTIKTCFLVLCLLLSFSSWGKKNKRMKTFYLITSEVRSLEGHLLRYDLSPKEIKRIKKLNPQVSDFEQIPSGIKLVIRMPLKKYKKGELNAAQADKLETLRELSKPIENKVRKIGLFYTYSLGDFVQTVGSKDVETSQNSPITLGLSYLQEFDEDYNFSSSIYYSQLNAVTASGLGIEAQSLRNPYEYGLTSYIEWKNLFGTSSTMPYAGIDYESFDAYNIDEIIKLSAPADFRRQNILYGTIGVTHSFSLLQHPFLMKLSASQSVFSKSENSSNYKGNRLLIFLTTPIMNNWSFHLLLKRHNLTGPSDMKIMRMGAGIGYNF